MTFERFWTPQRERVLREMARVPVFLADIARRLGTRPDTVRLRVKKLGISLMRPGVFPQNGGIQPAAWSQERCDELRGLWAQGLSCSAIGKRMGTTASAIAGKARRLGLPTRDRVGATRKSDSVRRARQAVKDSNGGAPKRKPRPKAVPVAVVTPDHARPWIERNNLTDCHYPYGERGNIHACCLPRWNGTPYCEGHAAVMYVPSKHAA